MPVKEVDFKFDPNGGEGEANTIKVKKGAKYQMPKCEFLKNGYFFEAWCLNPRGTARTFKAGETVEFFTDMVFYAKWAVDSREKVDFTFRYKTETQEGEPNIQERTVKAVKNEEYVFTEKDYGFLELPSDKEFDKWVVEGNESKEYRVKDKINADKAYVFLAVLKDKET